jgi:type VI protein secretion system component VasF
LIVVGEKAAQFTVDQLQAINTLAQQAGFENAHVQAMSYLQAAAMRFATQPTTPLHAAVNTRNPMLWRLISVE